MDHLALGKGKRGIQAADAHRLPRLAYQIAPRLAGFGMVERIMAKAGQVKIRIQFTVDAPQQVDVERLGNARRIVVGVQDHRRMFFQIKTNQQPVAGIHFSAQPVQEIQCFGFGEIADIGTQEKYHFARGSVLPQVFQSRKILILHGLQMQSGQFLPDSVAQFPQCLRRNVNRHIRKRNGLCQKMPEQNFGFQPVARAEFNQIESPSRIRNRP